MADTIKQGVIIDFQLLGVGLQNAVAYSESIGRNIEKAYQYARNLSQIKFPKGIDASDIKNYYKTVWDSARAWQRVSNEIDKFIQKQKQAIVVAQALGKTNLVDSLKQAISQAEHLKQKLRSAVTSGFRNVSIDQFRAKLQEISANVSIINTRYKEQQKILERLNTIETELLRKRERLSTGIAPTGITSKELSLLDRYLAQVRKTKQELQSLSLTSEAFGDSIKRATILASNAMKDYAASVRAARQAQLDLIRGKELSQISRAMATYPFSAHEIAKPAEQLTTSFFIAGPAETFKQWWQASRQVATQQGRATAVIFAKSFGQYIRQNFARAFGAWLGAAFTTFPVAYGVARLVGEINQQYNDLVEVSRYVQSATVSVTGSYEDLKTIMNDIIKLSIKTGESFRNVGKALWEMRSAGFGAQEALVGTEIAIKLATLSGEMSNLGETTRIVAGMYRLFKDQFEDTADVAERFKNIFGKVVYTLNISQISLKEMLKAFEYFGGTAKIAGMSLEQMLSYISVLSDQRLPGVGRAARQAVNQLAQALPMLAEKYGIVLDVTQPIGEQINIVFSTLNKRIKEGVINTQEFATWMKEAGVRGAPAILGLAANWDEVIKRQELLSGNMTEFFDTISEVRMDYFIRQWQRLKNAMLGVSSGGIHPLKQSMADFFAVMADGFDKLWFIIEKIKPELLTISTLVGAVTGGIRGGLAGAAIGVGTSVFGKEVSNMRQKLLFGGTAEDFQQQIIGDFTNLILAFKRKAQSATGFSIFDLLFPTGYARKQEKVEKLAEEYATKLNIALKAKFQELNISEDIYKDYLFNPEELKKLMDAYPDDIAVILQKRIAGIFSTVSEKAGISIDDLKRLDNVGKETISTFNQIEDSLADFAVTLQASSGAAVGHISAIDKMNAIYKTFAANILGFVDRYSKMQQILAEVGGAKNLAIATEDVQKKFQELAHDAQIYLAGAKDYFSDLAKANATFARILDQVNSKILQYRKGTGDFVAGIIKQYEDLNNQLERVSAIADRNSPLRKLLDELNKQYKGKYPPAIKSIVDGIQAIISNAEEAKEKIQELKAILATGKFYETIRSNFDALFRTSVPELKDIFEQEKESVYEKVFGEKYNVTELEKLKSLRKSLLAGREELVAKGILTEEEFNKQINALDLLIATRERLINTEKLYSLAVEEANKVIEEQRQIQERLQEKQRDFSRVSTDIYQKQLSMLPSWKRGIIDITREYNELVGELNNLATKYPDLQPWVDDQKKVLDDWFNWVAGGYDKIQQIQDNMFSSLKNTFTDFLVNFKFNMDTIVNIFRRAAAQMVVEWITSWLKMKMATGGIGFSLIGNIFQGLAGLFSGTGVGGASYMPVTIDPNTLAITYHSGGVVGETFNSLRLVPAGIFANAPKLHSGLAPDEFPAILQRGEIVLPKDTKIRESEPQAPVIIINAIDVKTFEDYVKRNPGAIITVVNDALKRNTALTATVRSL